MGQRAALDTRMWPVLWHMRRTVWAMSVLSPAFSGLLFATAFRIRFASCVDVRASPNATLMKWSWWGDMNARVRAGRHLAYEATSDLLEERLSLVVDRPEILADLFDGLRRNGRRPDDLWGPPDLFLDLVENRTVATNDHSRREGLDRHLARLRLEIDPGNLRLRRDDLADDLLRFLRRREQ